jgi:hypothetical protein
MKRTDVKDNQSIISFKSSAGNGHSGNSRRSFLRTGLMAVSGLVIARTSTGCSGNAAQAKEIADNKSCIDFGRSFLCNTAEFNSVRMWIESRTTITDPKSGESTVYYQGASCKSENTFGEKDLFIKDNYDFLPIFGDGKVLVFRRKYNKRDEGYKTIKKMEELWGANPVIYLPVPEVITELDTWEKIRDATAAGLPIVTRTEFQNPDTGLQAVIECPCKTMNISHPKKVYQVDTGPVAFPDLSKVYDVQIDCLSPAFIAFNKPDFADFVIEAPTPIMDGEKEVAIVYHYIKMVTITGKNKLFALGKL